MEKLAELTELGLTTDAARDLLKQEKEVEAIKQLIKEKHDLKQHQSGLNERGFINKGGQGGQTQHGNGKQVNSKAYLK